MRIKKSILVLFVMFLMSFGFSITAYADDVGDTGGTDGGGSGTNVYTFYYSYDAGKDAIVLTVNCLRPINDFGNSTSHTFSSVSDNTYIPSSNPRLGSSLESAISAMDSYGGYNLSVSDVKAKLNALGYYDGGNGIWRRSGGYLTYIDAVKIRPKKHTVHYDANGGTGAPADQTKKEGITLTLRSGKPTRVGWTFKYWVASIGGHYSPGGSYTHDQDGGVVTMKAHWKDETAPKCSSFYAIPNYWSAGNGTIGFTVQDQGSGISSIVLERYSYVIGRWSTVSSWSYNGRTSAISKTLSETQEGVFYYRLTITDAAGNSTVKTSQTIYLDHSNPVIHGLGNTVTDWTNIAPVISVNGTDYLSGTAYTGSGCASISIYDDQGVMVADGGSTTSFTLTGKYEGIHTWTVICIDNVGHRSSGSVTTKYDCTKPGVDGTEITDVLLNGVMVSGYCRDNIIDQHLDDEAWRSVNNPNCTSGIRALMLYKVKNGVRTSIRTDRTQKSFSYSDTHSYFDLYYDINVNEPDEAYDYYLIVVEDYAGNITTKKLTSQMGVLKRYHTSIDRNSYSKNWN